MEHNFRVDNNTVTLRNRIQSLRKMNLSKIYEFRQPVRNHRIPSADWINTFMRPLEMKSMNRLLTNFLVLLVQN
jgi:hypothetical protein